LSQVSKPGLTIIVSAPVELATVAGGKKKAGSPGPLAALKQGKDFGPRKSEALPLLHRRRMVA
jgi:hypothetical protein